MALKFVEGKVIVRIDLEGKNWHTFSDGKKIRLERRFDNLNKRETESVNGIVISGKDIPEGAEILIHHNAASETNQIHNYRQLSGKVTGSDVKYYSIPEDQCFAWYDRKGWKPIIPYDFCLRVFKPYEGVLEGISPTPVKDCLYITTGNYKGLCCRTVKAADYEIIFQDTNGREGRIIRCRPDGDEKHNREPEVIAIDHYLTKKINKGEYLIGLSISDCKPIKELINA